MSKSKQEIKMDIENSQMNWRGRKYHKFLCDFKAVLRSPKLFWGAVTKIICLINIDCNKVWLEATGMNKNSVLPQLRHTRISHVTTVIIHFKVVTKGCRKFWLRNTALKPFYLGAHVQLYMYIVQVHYLILRWCKFAQFITLIKLRPYRRSMHNAHCTIRLGP